jgi:hypothetical protein
MTPSEKLDPYKILSKSSGEKHVEVARHENTQPGICPKCGTQMRILSVSGIESYVCLTDRVCLPATDSPGIDFTFPM